MPSRLALVVLCSDPASPFKLVQPVSKGHSYPAELMTTHHWYRQLLDQKQVLNSITGKMDTISPQPVGSALLDANSLTVELEGYRLGGDLDRTISWYDREGRWRALEFKAKDGSDIQVIWGGGQLIKETSLDKNKG